MKIFFKKPRSDRLADSCRRALQALGNLNVIHFKRRHLHLFGVNLFRQQIQCIYTLFYQFITAKFNLNQTVSSVGQSITLGSIHGG